MSAREQAEQELWPGDGERQPNLYAVLDAAQDTSIYVRLRRAGSGVSVLPLYEGAAAIEMAGVAPYLVGLGAGGPLFDWLWEAGWGRNWGIFLWSTAKPDALRSHLRRLTRARTEDGRDLLFRFYDPRVMAAFLPTCGTAQLEETFGPIDAIAAEVDGGTALEKFQLVGGALKQSRVALQQAGA